MHRSMPDINYFIAIGIGLLVLFGIMFAAQICLAGDISENFSAREFICKHCGEGGAHPELITKLESLRVIIGNKPIIVTSGYRCKEHNKNVGGVENSYHTLGMAADIKVTGIKPSILAQFAKDLGFFVIVYKTWIHVDIR